MTIFNYKKILLKDVKVLDEKGNTIKNDILIFVKNSPLADLKDVLKVNRRKVTKKQNFYRRNSIFCVYESEILKFL